MTAAPGRLARPERNRILGTVLRLRQGGAGHRPAELSAGRRRGGLDPRGRGCVNCPPRAGLCRTASRRRRARAAVRRSGGGPAVRTRLDRARGLVGRAASNRSECGRARRRRCLLDVLLGHDRTTQGRSDHGRGLALGGRGVRCALRRGQRVSPEAQSADFSSLRHIVYGASPISESLRLRAHETFGAQLSQSYGLTETLGVTTLLGPADHVPDPATVHRLRSAGRAVPGIEVAVVDPASGDRLPPGGVGEVVVRGPSVTPATGAARMRRPRPSCPAAGCVPATWAHSTRTATSTSRTGSRPHRLRWGEHVPGRGGECDVGPSHVADVAVIGIPSQRWGETPLAVVVPVPGQEIDRDGLIAFCRERTIG